MHVESKIYYTNTVWVLFYSNMAANLQDGRSRLSGNAMICLKNDSKLSWKDNLVKLMLSSRLLILFHKY